MQSDIDKDDYEETGEEEEQISEEMRKSIYIDFQLGKQFGEQIAGSVGEKIKQRRRDEKEREAEEKKRRDVGKVYFENSGVPISKSAFATLTRLRRLYDKVVLSPPEPLTVQNPWQFISEAGVREDLDRLETGIWYVMKNVQLSAGPRVVVGLLILSKGSVPKRNDYIVDIIAATEHGMFPLKQPWKPIYQEVEDAEIPALLQSLPQGVTTKIQQRLLKSEVRLLLL